MHYIIQAYVMLIISLREMHPSKCEFEALCIKFILWLSILYVRY
jgi:hypothetical protein